jgi:hypothetical protein
MLTPDLERRVEPRTVITKGMACLKRHGELIECAPVIATGSLLILIDPAYPCSSSSRTFSGLKPTAVFALATPKSPIDRGGKWQLHLS